MPYQLGGCYRIKTQALRAGFTQPSSFCMLNSSPLNFGIFSNKSTLVQHSLPKLTEKYNMVQFFIPINNARRKNDQTNVISQKMSFLFLIRSWAQFALCMVLPFCGESLNLVAIIWMKTLPYSLSVVQFLLSKPLTLQ